MKSVKSVAETLKGVGGGKAAHRAGLGGGNALWQAIDVHVSNEKLQIALREDVEDDVTRRKTKVLSASIQVGLYDQLLRANGYTCCTGVVLLIERGEAGNALTHTTRSGDCVCDMSTHTRSHAPSRH